VHRGTCLRFIDAICLSNVLSLTLSVLMCFTWCISIFLLAPQFAHGCLNELMVVILQFFVFSGSLVTSEDLKLVGFRVKVGGLKFKSITFPLRFLI